MEGVQPDSNCNCKSKKTTGEKILYGLGNGAALSGALFVGIILGLWIKK